ncbi:MAG TPA: PDZ domain-containing protein [Burkholderiales bacterium]|nr:PDZ domain-containing protein [Burkholderiales bacterium]
MYKHIILLLMVFLPACASNGFEDFYTSVPGATPEAIAAHRAALPPETPKLIRINQAGLTNSLAALGELGYQPIGYSSFNGGSNVSSDDALEEGENEGADVVVFIDPSYTGTVSGEYSISSPTSTTSYTSGTVTDSYGNTLYGNATTTTQGTTTTQIPYSFNRYDYGAIYFVKNYFLLGAGFRNLNTEETAMAGTNRGVRVIMIVRGSPAFRNDILVGDIIESINGTVIYGEDEAFKLITASAGKTISLTILRKGKIIRKSAQLAPPRPPLPIPQER